MDKKKVLIRVDGDRHMGLGHIYRGIAIAEMVGDEFNCSFVMRNGSIHGIIPSVFPVSLIPGEIATNEEADWLKENMDLPGSVIILDGYQFGSVYQKKIKEKGFRLIYIDDLHRDHMYADCVINHAPGQDPGAYKKEAYTRLLLGSEYALLRSAFIQQARQEAALPGAMSNALICMGGSDEHNLAGKMVEALETVPGIKTIHVILGAAYSFREEMLEKAARSKKQVSLFSNLSAQEMIGLIQQCSIALAPSSNTCLEIMAVKRTLFSGFSAANQLDLYTYFTKQGLAFDLGDLHTVSPQTIASVITAKIHETETIQRMLQLQQELIDGYSDKRIKDTIATLFI